MNKIKKLTALKVANNYEHTIFLFPWRYPAFHWLSKNNLFTFTFFGITKVILTAVECVIGNI
jgi:hypothetical protein